MICNNTMEVPLYLKATNISLRIAQIIYGRDFQISCKLASTCHKSAEEHTDNVSSSQYFRVKPAQLIKETISVYKYFKLTRERTSHSRNFTLRQMSKQGRQKGILQMTVGLHFLHGKAGSSVLSRGILILLSNGGQLRNLRKRYILSPPNNPQSFPRPFPHHPNTS